MNNKKKLNNNKKSFLDQWHWLVPGLKVKRFIVLLAIGMILLLSGFLQFARIGPFHVFWTEIILQITNLTLGMRPLWLSGVVLLVFGLIVISFGIVGLNRSLLRAVGVNPSEALNQALTNRALGRGPRIVAIGGGSGLSNLLSGLKNYSANITAIVAVTDDGGSSGRLRESLDMPAPGDLIDCFAALSDSPVLAELLLHRFQRGGELAGHTFGNLFLATLFEQRGFAEAALAINEILNVRGRVIPATAVPAVLRFELAGGNEVLGESSLQELSNGRSVKRVHLLPNDPPAMPGAFEAIMQAELIVLGPGSLYTSVIPPLLVPEIAKALKQTKAIIVYVANFFTESGETDGMSIFDHTEAIAKHLNRWPEIVLVNSNNFDKEVIKKYLSENAKPLDLDLFKFKNLCQIKQTNISIKGSGQHDPAALAISLLQILISKRLGLN